jgi:hypothetical protein
MAEWEPVNHKAWDGGTVATARLPVTGGWLYRLIVWPSSVGVPPTVGLAFVPDRGRPSYE